MKPNFEYETTLEEQFRLAIEDATVSIIIDDERVRKLIHWVINEEVEMEEEPDFLDMMQYINTKYGARQWVVDRALLEIESQLQEK